MSLDIDTLVTLQKTIAFAAMALLVITAYSDIRTFRIPNVVVLAITALGIGRLLLLGDPIAATYAVGAVLFIFVIGFALFSGRLIGAGDVKLLLATMLLIRYRDIFEFFVLMSGFGALLSAIIAFRKHVPLGPRLAMSRSTVPYGVAISAAAIATLLLQPLLFRYSVPFGLSFLW